MHLKLLPTYLYITALCKVQPEDQETTEDPNTPLISRQVQELKCLAIYHNISFFMRKVFVYYIRYLEICL